MKTKSKILNYFLDQMKTLVCVLFFNSSLLMIYSQEKRLQPLKKALN